MFQPLRHGFFYGVLTMTTKVSVDCKIHELLDEIGSQRVADDSPCFVVNRSGCSASLRPVNGWLYLQNIRTDEHERGRGCASDLLNELCELADNAGITIFLEVDAAPGGSMTDSQLMDWYWRFGFRGGREEMVREPQGNDD